MVVSIFSVSIINFEKVKSYWVVGVTVPKNRDIVPLLFVKNVKKNVKNVVRGELKTRDTSKMDLFAKNSLLFKVVNNFNKKLHITIYHGVLVLKHWLFILNFVKYYLMAYLCRTPSRRYIYKSFCTTLVFKCANDYPYGVLFIDICLKFVITTSVLILLFNCISHWEDLLIVINEI